VNGGVFTQTALFDKDNNMNTCIPRRILLCATGMSPQIVTETLYALAVPPKAAQTDKSLWIPNEIHLISTSTGAAQARLNLLSDTPGWFNKLCQDYHLPAIHFTAQTIHCIQDAEGEDLDDIRSPADNEAAANSIAELVRKLTQDAHTELHVSLAGGRKTMGYYLGYALSLYGRSQDRLSHILVKGAFEGHPNFYYPTPYQQIIQTRDPKAQALDCADAIVQIAEIPFVRLRDGLPQRLLDGKANFTETVEVANLALGPTHLKIDKTTRNVLVNDIQVKLSDTLFALLYWFAERALSNNPEIHWDQYQEWHDGYIPMLLKIFGEDSSVLEDAQAALTKAMFAKNDPMIKIKKYFEPIKSKLMKTLKDQLSEALANRCAINKMGRDEDRGYSLPADIKITII
jgi:CRISPR-associated protein (TIGR02584 family)